MDTGLLVMRARSNFKRRGGSIRPRRFSFEKVGEASIVHRSETLSQRRTCKNSQTPGLRSPKVLIKYSRERTCKEMARTETSGSQGVELIHVGIKLYVRSCKRHVPFY